MNILKQILIITLLFIIPMASFGQLGKKIILSTGDTVRVVNQKSFLTSKDIKFLRKDTLSRSKLLDYTSDYNSIEEAALVLDNVMSEINTSQSLSQKNNESLSVRIATRNLRNQKKEQDLQNTWDNIIASEASLEELTELYKSFEGKPSYFINGILVEDRTTNKLRPNEIMSRNIRTIDTATGNPNGEIWYEVTPQAFRRLGITNDTPIEEPINIPIPVETQAPIAPTQIPGSHPRFSVSEGTATKEVKQTPVSTPTQKEDKKNSGKRSVRQIKENRAQKYNSAN